MALGDGQGYADARYARSLREFGTPIELAASGGWLLVRDIPDTGLRDAIGAYPLFSCHDWSRLDEDLDRLPRDLVSLTLVTDPFGAPSEDELAETFDVVRPYKDHLLIDLDRPPETIVARHHRKSARKGLALLKIEQYDPSTELDTWYRLYGHLVQKHDIRGLRAFSSDCFRSSHRSPGSYALKATLDDEVLGMHWYLTAGSVVYAHLAALHPEGYRSYTSHALFWSAIELFAEKFRWLDMGAGAGPATAADDGLTRFKQAWCSDAVPTYICGKVLDHAGYDELTAALGCAPDGYFPAYRAGEFVAFVDEASR